LSTEGRSVPTVAPGKLKSRWRPGDLRNGTAPRLEERSETSPIGETTGLGRSLPPRFPRVHCRQEHAEQIRRNLLAWRLCEPFPLKLALQPILLHRPLLGPREPVEPCNELPTCTDQRISSLQNCLYLLRLAPVAVNEAVPRYRYGLSNALGVTCLARRDRDTLSVDDCAFAPARRQFSRRDEGSCIKAMMLGSAAHIVVHLGF